MSPRPVLYGYSSLIRLLVRKRHVTRRPAEERRRHRPPRGNADSHLRAERCASFHHASTCILRVRRACVARSLYVAVTHPTPLTHWFRSSFALGTQPARTERRGRRYYCAGAHRFRAPSAPASQPDDETEVFKVVWADSGERQQSARVDTPDLRVVDLLRRVVPVTPVEDSDLALLSDLLTGSARFRPATMTGARGRSQKASLLGRGTTSRPRQQFSYVPPELRNLPTPPAGFTLADDNDDNDPYRGDP